MLILNAESISKAFGTKRLFKDISVTVFEGDKIGFIGENGSGKSTFLKIVADLETPDTGILSKRKGLIIGYLPQSVDFPDQKPIEILMQALNVDIPEYEKERLAETWLSKLGFKGDESSAAHLSGGWKKRLGLAKEMIANPDLLLLDEPTNHLDLEGILWLEKFLRQEVKTYIIVSHDRYFLQNATNRIIEIGSAYPNGVFSISDSYSVFLTKKEEFLQGQLQQERSMASKARREVEWLKSNPKARTTKSRARIDQAEALLEDLSEVHKRNKKHRAGIDFTGSERETRKLLVAKNISKKINQRILFKNLDFTLSPGTRLGLMGPNGSGKTTLLRILANELAPDQGTIKMADKLQIVYFDQHRNRLPDHITLREALSPNADFVNYRGQSIHVNGWCKRFLFSPDYLDMPLSKLSGGERARIAIAHLMLQPADLLLLDEPTNDLDIPTLETLESSLLEFPGAVVLITHDRCMLDRICNSFMALGDPERNDLFATYSQWEAATKKIEIKEISRPIVKEKKTKSNLSYLEKKEFDQIEGKIQKLESKLRDLTLVLEDPELAYNAKKLGEIGTAIQLTEIQIEELYLRWEELNNKF